jgi:hypothetical protein
VFWFFQHRIDKKDSFEEYLNNDLKEHGFTLISSSFITDRTPAEKERYRTWLNPMAGGWRIVSFSGYKIYRTVKIKDRSDREHEVIAAIEYDDKSLFRRFERVIWEPPLDTLDINATSDFKL